MYVFAYMHTAACRLSTRSRSRGRSRNRYRLPSVLD
jgi:hypothetical protein